MRLLSRFSIYRRVQDCRAQHHSVGSRRTPCDGAADPSHGDRRNYCRPQVRRLPYIYATICGFALLLLTGANVHADTIKAQVFSVSGSVQAAAPNTASYAPIKKGDLLAIGSTIRTGDDGVAVIVTTPGSAVQIGNNSVVKLNKLAFAKTGGDITQRQAVLQLQSGVVSALIDPATPKSPTSKSKPPKAPPPPAARSTVLVYHGKTYVGVKEGKVAVRAAGG